MAITFTGILQVVVTRSDGSTQTIAVDPGTNLQAIIFDRGAADHCPGPMGNWPPAGMRTSQTTAATTTAPTLMAADTTTSGGGKGKPGGGATTMGDNCYLINGVIYCPPGQG